MKKYEQYIDSGFDWVGLVPKSWRQTQLKYISSISKGKKAKEDFQDFQEGMIPYLSMEYLRSQTDSPSYVYADDPIILLVDEQDLLILWDGSKAGEIVKAKKGALSSTMGKIHVESELFDLNYLTYYLKNAERYIQANTVGMGIPHVSGEVLRTLFITFPNKDIQTKIAQYLDYHTAIIDQLIQQKEKLIELLKEKRQAVINEAVTKGLNANAKMKDSGIEWLGEVPEHWSIKKLKFLVALNSNEEIRTETSFKVALENIESGTGQYIESTTENQFEGVGNYFKKGDVLFNKLRPYLAKVYLAEKEGCSVGELLVFTPKALLTSEYLFFRLLSSTFIEIVNGSTYGAKMPRASWNFIGNLPIPFPSMKEQQDIVEYIKEFHIKLNSLIGKSTEQIEKLKEYRQSIISEAVTGKIDVRDWQPNKIQVA